MNIDIRDIVAIMNALRLARREILSDPYGEEHPEERDRFVKQCDDLISQFDSVLFEKEFVVHVKD